MSDMILVYVVCTNALEAKKIAKILLQKKLIACANILDKIESLYFWPEGSNDIEEGKESLLLVKTLKDKYDQINIEIKNIHSYEIPAIFSINIDKVDLKYFQWLKNQLK
ncbi:MAG: Divalent-cation tolerance protein CutA [Candidatus Anoxychlamydiales bacterium]|nr:Divalent-cation tolerance protein CutA [Candidatus Anoxychlamydiales bacterium]